MKSNNTGDIYDKSKADKAIYNGAYKAISKDGVSIEEQRCDVNAACSKYLKEKTGAKRILSGMRTKIKSLGAVGGNIILKYPTDDEISFLRDVMKKDYAGKKSISISLKSFQDSFIGTRLDGIDLKAVLEDYFDEELISNKDLEAVKKEKYIDFTDSVSSLVTKEVKTWLKSLILRSNSPDGIWMRSLYRDDRDDLRKNILYLSNVISICAGIDSGLSRPALSFRATKDSHMLDSKTVLYKMLLYYLSYTYSEEYPVNPEDVGALLDRIGIIDDIGYRTVMTYGLIGFDRDGNELGWESFYLRHEPITLNYKNVVNVRSIEAYDNKVICFENPSVFSAFTKSNPMHSSICTAGQINRVEYKLMDLIYASGITIVYSGDFDPEGLLIAEKLYKRYPDIEFQGYSEENYLKALSDNVISERRLKQLSKLSHPILKEAGELVLKHKRAGYQEYVIEEL